MLLMTAVDRRLCFRAGYASPALAPVSPEVTPGSQHDPPAIVCSSGA